MFRPINFSSASQLIENSQQCEFLEFVPLLGYKRSNKETNSPFFNRLSFVTVALKFAVSKILNLKMAGVKKGRGSSRSKSSGKSRAAVSTSGAAAISAGPAMGVDVGRRQTRSMAARARSTAAQAKLDEKGESKTSARKEAPEAVEKWQSRKESPSKDQGDRRRVRFSSPVDDSGKKSKEGGKRKRLRSLSPQRPVADQEEPEAKKVKKAPVKRSSRIRQT